MVVLSASVVTKSGRVIVARQFVEMNRLRIEGLLAAFPKLVGSGNKQHTFIETDTVRYVWQPVEQIFLVLITNKASNIVEDLDTLRLLSKLVPEIAGGHTEEKLADKCFELVFAFDEVITPGGYREYIDLRQIRQNLEMDSHEEKLHNMVKKTKMDSAKDQANHMSKVIRSRQKEAAKSGGLIAAGTMTGIGGGGGAGGDNVVELEQQQGGTSRSQHQMGYELTLTDKEQAPIAATAPTNVQSIKLGKKPKGSTLLDKVAKEDNLNLSASLVMSKRKAQQSVAAEIAEVAVTKQPLTILVDEKLSCQLSQEGALENLDLKGTLSVTANDDSAFKAIIFVTDSDSTAPNRSAPPPPGLTFQVHPKVNKSEWEKRKVLTLKDKDKGFPVGRPVGVLRWSLQSNMDDSLVPFLINCWPEDEGDGTINVNIEYTLQSTTLELHNVQVNVPLGTSAHPHIVALDGAYQHDTSNQILSWQLALVDKSNATGTLEFTLQNSSLDAFYPITIDFTAKKLFYDLTITGVKHLDDESRNIGFSVAKALTTDNYQVS